MSRPMKAFISYSHEDSVALDRLLKHFAMLRRDKLLSEWFDQKILAGGKIDEEISSHLEECDLFIALVSPDFLASPYCFDTEMQRAIKRHEDGKLLIVSVIVQPCDWQSSELKKFKALPKDGKPVSEWINANTAYLDIANELRRLIENVTDDEAAPPPKTGTSDPKRRQYRVKRDFDEIDRAEFRATAFQEIREYFEAAIAEIRTVENIKASFENIGTNGFTCTLINRGLRNGSAHLTVHAKTGRMHLGDISYSHTQNAEPTTANGSYNIGNDDYDLFLTSSSWGRQSEEKRLSEKAAAEELWDDLLERAGIAYE